MLMLKKYVLCSYRERHGRIDTCQHVISYLGECYLFLNENSVLFFFRKVQNIKIHFLEALNPLALLMSTPLQ
jgi:hypothetical protein